MAEPSQPSRSGLVEVYVRVRPEDIVYVKSIFESYEVIGFLRTIDPVLAVLVVMLVPDQAAVGQKIIDAVAREIDLVRVPPPEDLGDDWLVGAVNEPDA